MPNLPSYRRRRLPSTNVGAAPVSASAANTGAGAIGRGMASLGQGVSNLGGVFAKLEADKNKNQDLIAESDSKADLKIAQDKYEALKLGNDDPAKYAEYRKQSKDEYFEAFEARQWGTEESKSLARRMSENLFRVSEAETQLEVVSKTSEIARTKTRAGYESSIVQGNPIVIERSEQAYRDALKSKYAPEEIDLMVAEASRDGWTNRLRSESQAIIDGGGTLKDAYAPIHEAQKAGLIDAKTKGTLTESASGYYSRMNKSASIKRHQKEVNSYISLSDMMLNQQADYDDVMNSDVDPDNMDVFRTYVKGSWTPDATEAELTNDRRGDYVKGQQALRDAVFGANNGRTGTLGAYDKLMKAFFVDKNITKEQYEWGLDKVENPYPRNLAPSIESVTVNQGRNWWGTSDNEINVEKNNIEFLEWVDKQIADGKEPGIGDMRDEMARIQAKSPAELPDAENVKTIDVVAPDGRTGTIPADELELHIKMGYRAI